MFLSCRCLNCITPPLLLEKLRQSGNPAIREAALATTLTTARLRGERFARAAFGPGIGPGDGRRTIYDCRNGTLQGAAVARNEDNDPVADESVNRAFDGLGATRRFFDEILGRNSIDDNGFRLNGYVHFGNAYNNAFWDGAQMVFGDGDGIVFSDLTGSLDVIGHELTHGVTEFAAGLVYHFQPGALNESMSDVFGSLVKQWVLGQAADEADWLIGPDIFTPQIDADALRSMKAPGTAYDNPDFGKDPQPDHMNKYVNLPDTDAGDYGGVHVNSGIPNKAFYLTAIQIGGNAWEAPGEIWYESLKASSPTTQFQDFADTTYMKAGQICGPGSAEQEAVLSAWREVGIRITAPIGKGRRSAARAIAKTCDADMESLAKLIAALSAQVNSLAKEVRSLKRT